MTPEGTWIFFFLGKSNDSRTFPPVFPLPPTMPPASPFISRPYRDECLTRHILELTIPTLTLTVICGSHGDYANSEYTPHSSVFKPCSNQTDYQTVPKFLDTGSFDFFMSPFWITSCLFKPSNPSAAACSFISLAGFRDQKCVPRPIANRWKAIIKTHKKVLYYILLELDGGFQKCGTLVYRWFIMENWWKWMITGGTPRTQETPRWSMTWFTKMCCCDGVTQLGLGLHWLVKFGPKMWGAFVPWNIC